MWYKNGKAFNSIKAIRNNEINISLPAIVTDEVIVELDYVKITETPKPVITELQTAYESGYEELADGSVVTVWTISDMFSDTEAYTDMEGNVVPAMTKAEHEAKYIADKQAETIAVMVQHFTDVTTGYIEDKIQAYNNAHGVAFSSIDAFPKYAMNIDSIYFAIANQFIKYADNIWTAVRVYQSAATAVPTDEEFGILLDGVVF